MQRNFSSFSVPRRQPRDGLHAPAAPQMSEFRSLARTCNALSTRSPRPCTGHRPLVASAALTWCPAFCEHAWACQQVAEARRQLMLKYITKEREDLYHIAFRECGLVDVSPILEHPDNELLFKRRAPSALKAGDEIWIPEKEELEFEVHECATGQRHTFVVERAMRRFHIRLVDDEGKPQDGAYKLACDGDAFEVEGSASGGVIDEQIPVATRTVTLTFGDEVHELSLGAIDPVHTTKGVQARLYNLGYPVAPVDGLFGPVTKSCVQLFQGDQELVVDGIVGPKTRKKLVEVYGI